MSSVLAHKMQNFTFGVRQQLGYPLVAPVNDSIAFASGQPADFIRGIQLSSLADEMRRDLIYSSWASVDATEPESFSLVIRELLYVEWIDRVFFWAADKQAPLVIVSARRKEHFVLGARGLLERRPGKPAKHLAAGKQLALKRIRVAAATMDDELSEENQWLPADGSWADRVPMSSVIQAA